ncbi:hypothetical protein PENSTE_c002G00037 [Penicillium steckii]|uniref:ORP1 like protein n=1 Tax=Penicillium steckii TaxID=303698 RepID=A0A1V6TVP3_9EURO|nr:hypothetical protein PENSTE_c002G00037 [Penicillium steckii]
MPYLTGPKNPKPDEDFDPDPETLAYSLSPTIPPETSTPPDEQELHSQEIDPPVYPSWTGLVGYPESFTRSREERELPDPRPAVYWYRRLQNSQALLHQHGPEDIVPLSSMYSLNPSGSPHVEHASFHAHQDTNLDTKTRQQNDSTSSDYQPVSSPDSSDFLTEYSDDDFSDYKDDLDETEFMASSPAFTDQSNTDPNVKCEFAEVCQMGADGEKTHYRKIISHIFGRNKSATKVFPQEVWVHYCRKHYQRARYRAGEWPFTQCNLLEESLIRMEQWGGVESFELILRRREQERIHGTDNQDDSGTDHGQTSQIPARPACKSTSHGKAHTVGRRNPRAVVAPVPDWLRDRTGKGLNFKDIGEIIREIRRYLKELRRVETKVSVKSETPNQSKKKKDPSVRTPVSPIRFPDIEIIPTFRTWALEEYERRCKLKREENTKKKGMELAKKKSPSKVSGGRSRGFNARANTPRSSHGVNDDVSRSPRTADIGKTGDRRQSLGRINSRGGVQKPL